MKYNGGKNSNKCTQNVRKGGKKLMDDLEALYINNTLFYVAVVWK